MNLIAENTKRIIEEQGVKQKSIAEKAGYTEQQFSRMMNDRNLISWHDVLRIAEALGVTPNDLYGIE